MATMIVIDEIEARTPQPGLGGEIAYLWTVDRAGNRVDGNECRTAEEAASQACTALAKLRDGERTERRQHNANGGA